MGWLSRRGAASFTPADTTATVHLPGPEPVGRFAAAVLDGSLGARLAARSGEHVPTGAYETRALGELGPRQRFVGAAQLQNKITNALGAPPDATAGGKAAADTTPVTAMQRVLSQVGTSLPWATL